VFTGHNTEQASKINYALPKKRTKKLGQDVLKYSNPDRIMAQSGSNQLE